MPWGYGRWLDQRPSPSVIAASVDTRTRAATEFLVIGPPPPPITLSRQSKGAGLHWHLVLLRITASFQIWFQDLERLRDLIKCN